MIRIRPSDLIGKRLFIIVAHPDDESFVAAGTIRKNTDAHGSTVVLCATRGERGASHLSKPLTMKALGMIRSRELRRASKLMGVTTLVQLGIPDGGVDRHQARLFKEASALVRRHAPDIIVSFGPDGISGHLDHIAVHQVALRVSRATRTPLLCAALPFLLTKGSLPWLKARRSHPHYARRIVRLRPTLRVRVDPAFKLRVLRTHRSQFDRSTPFSGFPKFIARSILSAEYFSLFHAKK